MDTTSDFTANTNNTSAPPTFPSVSTPQPETRSDTPTGSKQHREQNRTKTPEVKVEAPPKGSESSVREWLNEHVTHVLSEGMKKLVRER